MDLTQISLIDLRNAIHDRAVKSVDVVQQYLDRIEQHNPSLHAYHEVYAQQALERAAAVDAGQITGALAGVPIALKDNLCTAFGHTTCSSKMLADFQSPYTATAVKKLEQAGAIVLGKTILDEFAMGSSTETSAFGPTRNPWDTQCVPGGSSGGSAAAMAADLCAGAVGSDTGGSIRQPAALCGVVGMKPTYGRVSRYGLIAFASSLDQIGPLTHTVADAALLLSVMAGHDPHDSTSADLPVPDYLTELDQPLGELTIGLAKQYLSDTNHPAVGAAIQQACDVYRSLGAKIIEVDLPHTDYGIPTYYIVGTAEASSNLARYDGVHYGYRTRQADDLVDLYARSRAEGFGDEVKRRIMLGTFALSSGYHDAYYVRALKVRRLIQQDFIRAFADCDVILCPTTPSPAFHFDEKARDPLAMYLTDIYTVNCNLAGLPGISVPAGLAEPLREGDHPLPVAVQLIAPAFEEGRLLQVAAAYEKQAGHAHLRPGL